MKPATTSLAFAHDETIGLTWEWLIMAALALVTFIEIAKLMQARQAG